MNEQTDAWRAIYRVVLRDHSEYCFDVRHDCSKAAEIKTTDMYRAVADEVTK